MTGPRVLRRARRVVATKLRSFARAEPAATHPMPPGVLRLTATGRQDGDSRGSEVVVLEARTSSGLVVDLCRLSAPGVEVMRDIVVDGQSPVRFGLRLSAGASLDLPLGAKGSVLLLSHPWSGEVRLEAETRTTTIGLYSRRHEMRRFDLASLLPLLPPADTVVAGAYGPAFDVVLAEAVRLLEAQAALRTGDDLLDNTLAIYTPRWKGVTAATRNLFRCTLTVPLTAQEHPDDLEPGYLAGVAEAILASRFTTIVFSGGDPALFTLAELLKERRPSLSIRLLWHGSYLQMGEGHDWRLFRPWLEGGQSGTIDCIGVVKPGMDGFLRTLGVHSCFVQNIVPFDRAGIRPTRAGEVVGLWLSGSSEYRKLPYAALLALAGLPQFGLRAAGLGELGFRMVDELGVRTLSAFPQPIPHQQVLQEMRQTSLTLYVTLSECMPMVPLESIACGVPCIVGPATRFYDEPYLTHRLMVDDPADPQAIRRKMTAAMDEHDEVLRQSLAFLERLSERAAESLTRFLT